MFDEFFQKNNLPKYRIKQFNDQYYNHCISSFGDFKLFPKELREKMEKELDFISLNSIKEVKSINGNTIKVLFERKFDKKKIETVLMKHEDGRNTVCVSCMVGCPVNCRFCATGKLGFGGNLYAKEIVDQVMYFQRILNQTGEKVTNIVYMGMGEPMLNLVEVEKSIDILTDSEKLGMSQRRITVSTSGYINEFKKFIEYGFRGKIAISLHAPNQEIREKLMPVAKRYKLNELLSVLDEYVKLTNKRVSYEYILIRDVTDREEDANQLVKLFKNRLAHVNLIPYNKIQSEDFERSSRNRIFKFKNILDEGGINNSIRVTMGDDVNAACGQLAANSK